MDGKIGAYKTADTMAKSQIDLILQVYDGAIDNYRKGKDAFAAEEWRPGREALEKAKKFVVHLYTTLDTEQGGEVGENLGKLYTFVIMHTDIVASTKDLKQIDDIIEILSNLRQGWLNLKSEGTATVPKISESKPKAADVGQFSTSA